MSKKHITAVLVDRANYGRLKPLLEELKADDDIQLSIICCGSTVLNRFHSPFKDICSTFNNVYPIYHEVEGSNYESMVNGMAMLMPQLALTLRGLHPDYVMLIGDRYEALAVATTASMLGYCIIHLQGGERSGNIDDSIRHAITKLSHYHVPSNDEAKSYIVQLGEDEATVLAVGCPSADLVKGVMRKRELSNHVLCMYHPETGVANNLMIANLLEQLSKLKANVMMFWPNIDPGSDGINKVIRKYIDKNKPDWLTMMVNVDPTEFLCLLASVKCCVGNSSSFVRDASFFGTPVVLIGNRQFRRIKTGNVKWHSDYDLSALHYVVLDHMQKVFQPFDYYGKPGISKRIVAAIKNSHPYSLKAYNV